MFSNNKDLMWYRTTNTGKVLRCIFTTVVKIKAHANNFMLT